MGRVRLYIVDDQILAINYFRGLVEKAEGRYTLVGHALSATRALEEIPALRPDIVFVDVSMPVMDGLELSARLLRRSRELAVILLTSYRDFEYAKRGLQLGVASYIVKNDLTLPLLDAEITRVMGELNLEKERTAAYRRQNFLHFLRSGVEPGSEREGLQYHRGAGFLLLLARWRQPLRLDSRADPPPDIDCDSLEARRSENIWRVRIALPSAPGIWAIMLETAGACGQTRMQEQAAACAREIGVELGVPVTLFLSAITDSFHRLPELYAGLERDAGLAVFWGADRLVGPEEARPSGVVGTGSATELTAALQAGDRPAARALVARLLEQAAQEETIDEFTRIARELLALLEQRWPGRSGTADGLAFPTATAAIHWLCGLLERPVYSRKVEAAIAFIHRQYREDIDLADVAEAVALSAGHLRRIFRAETGQSVPGYLRAHRIEQAKRCIRQGGGSLGQIGEAVGFASSQYFSLVFKQTTGMTPREYQRTCR